MAQEDLLNASKFLDEPVEQEAQDDPASRLTALSESIERPESASDFLPETLSLGGVDTGISLKKGSAAALVGMGDGMLDLWHGLEQILGNKEIELKLQEDQNRMSELYNDPRYGTKARSGQVGGFLVDPVGVMIPVGKGKKLWDVAKTGAATGAAFGGLGYVDEANGQTRAGNALVGAITGGILSPALFGTTRAVKGVGGKMQERAATKMLNTYKKEFYRYISEGRTPTQASHFAMKKMGWTTEDKAGLIIASRRPFNIDQRTFTPDAALKQIESINAESLVNRTIDRVSRTLEDVPGQSRLAARIRELGRGGERAIDSAVEGVGKVLVPLSTKLAKIDPDIALHLRKMEADQKIQHTKLRVKMQSFLNKAEQIEKSRFGKQFQQDLMSEDIIGAKAIWRQMFGSSKKSMKDFDDMRAMLDDLHKQAVAAGYRLPKNPAYFPRRVKDLEGLTNYQDSELGRLVAEFRSKHLKEPSEKQLNAMIQSITNPIERGKFRTGGSLLKRQKHKLDDTEIGFYHNVRDTLDSYIEGMTADIHRARFLQRIGNKPGQKGFALDGSDVTDRLDNTISKRQGKGFYHAQEVEKLTGLLRSRFTKGEMAPNAAVGAFKNATYIATLGNFKSAMTQLGDLAWSAHRNGVINTSLELMNRVPGLKRIIHNSHKRVTKEQIGLEDAIQEFAGDQGGKRALDWILQKTQFKRMDKLGKETFINSHFRKVKKALNSGAEGKTRAQLRRKWEPVFGGETDAMIADLKNGRFSDNVAVYLFDSLSDVQPISLSEMPQAYLDHPNGRIFYMLRSFTIKQLDLMRRDSFDAMARGDAPTAFKNIASLGALFVAANGSADMLKDFMSGKEIDMEDTLVDNIWKFAGLNRYTGDKLSTTPGQAIIDTIAPPFTVYDRAIRGADSSSGIWQSSPFNGLQVFDKMFNDGTLTRTESDDYQYNLDRFSSSMDDNDE